MINYTISHGKTLFDIFNMINPNCYQALVAKAIIEDKKEEAIRLCDELSTALKYYNWDATGAQSSYVDALICESSFDEWKKHALIRIISNNVAQCKEILEKEIENDRRASQAKSEHSCITNTDFDYLCKALNVCSRF